MNRPYVPKARTLGDLPGSTPVISFARSDRECSPVWTALRGPESISMFVRGDRSRQHRTLAATRGRMLAQVSSSHLRSGPVRFRTDKYQSRRGQGCGRWSRTTAVETDEQNQRQVSGASTSASWSSCGPGFSCSNWRSRSARHASIQSSRVPGRRMPGRWRRRHPGTAAGSATGSACNRGCWGASADRSGGRSSYARAGRPRPAARAAGERTERACSPSTDPAPPGCGPGPRRVCLAAAYLVPGRGFGGAPLAYHLVDRREKAPRPGPGGRNGPPAPG